jgi:ribose transport system substrate-binding protein
MKAKSIGCIAAASLALAVTACGDSDSGASGSGNEAGPKKVRVAMLLPGLGQGAAQQVKAGFDKQKPKEKNADIVFRAGTSDADVDQYISNLEDAVSQGFDVMIVVPQDPKRMKPVLTRAVKAGIKIVFVEADDTTFPDRTAAAFTDQATAAQLDGEYLAKALPNGGKLGVLHCLPGNAITDARVAGMKKGLASNTDVKIVSTLDAKCDREKGRSAMEDMLTAHPDLDAVYSVSDTQTLGALAAIQAKGLTKLIVSSIDAQDEMVKKLREGLVGSTVSLNFERGGELAVSTAVKIARGEKVPAMVDTGATLVTNENASQQ